MVGAIVLLVSGGACSTSRASGVLTGHAIPCVGSVLPHTTLGPVDVQVRSGSGADRLVASQSVPANATYRFDLPAGSYTVQAAGGPPLAATVVARTTTKGDLLPCK